MLRKRVIFTLIYADGYFHQSRNFRLQRVGNLQWLEKNYKFQNIAGAIDELIVLNASKSNKDIIQFSEVVSKLVANVFIPIAAGGGIRTLQDAEKLFQNGADKIVLNSVLAENSALVNQLGQRFGSQAIVANIDVKKSDNEYAVYVNNGTRIIDGNLFDYLKFIQDQSVGEIYLNSIDKDGTGFGFDEDLMNFIEDSINLPLIIAGGAGNEEHLAMGLDKPYINAVATANLFNFIGNGLPLARQRLIDSGYNLARWTE
jgi:cyclase